MTWCGRVVEMPHERPCIILLLDDALDAGISEAIGRGCEEEGIPLAWESARVLGGAAAYGASLRSRLDVGIAAEGGRAFLGVAQLPERAWMEIEIVSPEDWRWVGQAAARLVKGQPLPPRWGECPKEDEGARPPAPPRRDTPSPVPAAGLFPMSAPYREQREAETEEDTAFEELVALVTRRVMGMLDGGKR